MTESGGAGADASRIQDRLRKGILELNDEAFFEAHDTLEDLWMDVRGDDRPFFHGMIQIAIGCYHASCGNRSGADHLLGRAIEKLSPFLPAHRGVRLDLLVPALRALREAVRGAEGPQTAWHYPKVEVEGVD